MAGARAHPTGFTYEDYLLFPEDGRRHELIEGEHVVTPAPCEKHQRLAMRLGRMLDTHADAHGLGRVYPAPFDVILSERDVVQPDLLFVTTAHGDRITERGVRGAPDLVVEIASETTRRVDEIVKRKLYEGYGVQEYWVVDPEVETVKVYRLTGGTFTRIAELTREAADVLTSPLLPGLEIALLAIFR